MPADISFQKLNNFGAKTLETSASPNRPIYPSCFTVFSSSFLCVLCWQKASPFVLLRRNMDTFVNIKNILVKFYDEYNQTTPKKLKIVDSYLFYIMLTGIIQFAYCCLVGTFPFNSFLSGFISCVGSFVLGGKTR